jgi:hypothetical protein
LNFKTICSNGTGGFIAVIAKKNKTWNAASKESTTYLLHLSDLCWLRRQTYAQEDDADRKSFFGTDEEIRRRFRSYLTYFLQSLGMFDEADEITLPFGSLHQFQTIPGCDGKPKARSEDEPNRLSCVRS